MSINIQELRIGNYVMAGDTLNPRKVESIFSGLRRARLRSDRGDSSTFSEDEMIPIEITEEWLLKLGYRQHGHTGYWYHEKCRFPVFKPTDARTCLMNDLDFLMTDKMQYVHQLQNIFYAITGEELTLKSET